MNVLVRALIVPALVLGLSGCSTMEPLRTVEQVDLERFMGQWYVIANIPTVIEKNAYNAVETYRLDSDGSIPTTFEFRKGSFEGPRKVYTPRGFVEHPSNAVWGMQFIWPFKSDYRIIYLDAEYSVTVIGRNKRDFLWVMAREPAIAETQYEEILVRVAAAGYDLGEIRKVPQQW